MLEKGTVPFFLDPFGGWGVRRGMRREAKFQLRVASPCRASWDVMDGDDQARFCRECSRNVYNLSEMTEAEARRLVAEREGRLCVRFYQRRDGTVLTSDCPVGRRRTFLRNSAGTAFAVAGIALAASGLSACGPVDEWVVPSRDDQPRLLMGKIAPHPDAGVPEAHRADDPDQWIVGEVVAPEGRAIMGSIALPPETE